MTLWHCNVAMVFLCIGVLQMCRLIWYERLYCTTKLIWTLQGRRALFSVSEPCVFIYQLMYYDCLTHSRTVTSHLLNGGHFSQMVDLFRPLLFPLHSPSFPSFLNLLPSPPCQCPLLLSPLLSSLLPFPVLYFSGGSSYGRTGPPPPPLTKT